MSAVITVPLRRWGDSCAAGPGRDEAAAVSEARATLRVNGR